MDKRDLMLIVGSMLLLSAGVAAAASAISSRALPLGDGKVTSVPRIGYVDSCQTTFPPNAPGAFAAGPWIKADGTWDATVKISVQGSVSWPQARNTVRRTGACRVITTEDLPVRQGTGVFPIAPGDPAYRYDRNPNRVEPQSIRFTLPSKPKRASRPGCLNLGPIGVLKDGVVLFDALDAAGRDAVAHEILDRCDGHPLYRYVATLEYPYTVGCYRGTPTSIAITK